MPQPLKTVIVGFGQIADGFSEDPLMTKYFPYATHAQVLAQHPLFSWQAVVDPSPEALASAQKKWNIPITVRQISDLPDNFQPDIAVIATPPDQRIELIERMPSIKGIFVEKPLGRTLTQSNAFVATCQKRNLPAQVNFWRRGDDLFRRLAHGELYRLIGEPVAVFGLYGNGLKNNGCHMIDFVQMLLGEITNASLPENTLGFPEGPIRDDINIPFLLTLANHVNAMFQPIPFSHFRENSLDIWGEHGRLAIYQESLGIYLHPKKKNRGLVDEWEIASDRFRSLLPTCGHALYRLYDNLAEAVLHATSLWSPLEAALNVDDIIHTLIDRYQNRKRVDG